MGTLNIIDWCKENGNPSPQWKERSQSVITTFLPSTFFATEKAVEEPVLTSGSFEDKIANLLRTRPLSKSELVKELGHKRISGALKRTLSQMLAKGMIAHTIPEKPTSKMQKFRIQEDLPN